MQLYHYDNNHFYCGTSVAELSPVDELPLIPRGSTPIEPPVASTGYSLLFLGGAWRSVKNTPDPTPEEIAAQAEAEALRLREEAKQARQAAVDSIVVEVNGKVFDGDETSQTRMTRAIIGMQATGQATGQATIQWTLADNTVTQATLAELTEALCLAGAQQSDLWRI